MHRHTAQRRQALKLCFFAVAFALGDTAAAANIRDYIESARNTPIVYVGVVGATKKVHDDVCFRYSRAEIDVKVIGRGDATATRAGFVYPSDLPKHEICTGGPRYSLERGTWVLVFALAFEQSDRPSYLYKGTRAEIVDAIRKLADSVPTLTAEQLTFNDITEAQRDEQVALYRRLLERMTTAENPG
jgi:hypothetical protein